MSDQEFRVVDRNNLLSVTTNLAGYAYPVQIAEDAFKRWDGPEIGRRLTALAHIGYLRSQATQRDSWRAAGISDIDPSLATWDDVAAAEAQLPD